MNIYALLRCILTITAASLAWNITFADGFIPPPPLINANAYILMDYHSGKVLAASKADERMEPASLTKIMSSYVVSKELRAGHIHLSDMVTISEHAWHMEGSRTFLQVGTQVSVENLLKGMIIQSGNDATVALAEHIGGSEDVFVSMMNQTTKELGLNSTHFANSTGLPNPQHYTTAHDLAILARALIHDFPEHYSWYSQREFFYNGIAQRNRNRLLWTDNNVDGIKTGHTDSAGYCLVASAHQGDMRLISVVLGTTGDSERARESEKLLSYGFNFYETHPLYAADQVLTQLRVWKGTSDTVPLVLAHTLYVTVPRGQYKELKATLETKPGIVAPVHKGAAYATLKVSLNEQTVTVSPLVAVADVAEGNLFQRIIDTVWLWFK
jgi:serine-type D-Ala-D-Ala carboxypeptidase (penicillin-binding protein 5/6)